MPTPLKTLPAAAALGLAAFGQFALTAPAQAQSKKPQAAFVSNYKLSLGGLRLAKGTINIKTSDKGYNAVVTVSARGIMDWFVAGKLTTKSAGGWTSKGGPAPKSFSYDARIDKKTYLMTMRFKGGAPSSVAANPPYKKRSWQIDPRRQNGAIDPIAAIVAAMTPARSESICGRRLDMFDGRRRSVISLGQEISRENFEGGAYVECKGMWRRVAGYSKKTMKKPGREFFVRFKVDRDGLAVPVRLWAFTPFGAMVVSQR